MEICSKSDLYKASEKSEHDPNIFTSICSVCFVCKNVVEAPAIKDLATLDPVFGFPGKGGAEVFVQIQQSSASTHSLISADCTRKIALSDFSAI